MMQNYLEIIYFLSHVMVGNKSEVMKTKNKFASTARHCANHTIQILVSATGKSVSGINRFKTFIDELL
jgi:hypothetical protein